jgi:oligosaccharide repeat unit polymerase
MRDLIIETQKFVKSNRLILFLSLLGVSLLCGIISLYWQFWLLLGIIVYIASIVYFSKEIYGLLNIHVAALSLLVLHALPSTILILEGEINLDNQESLMLFSSITIGLIGYTFGALFLKKLFSFEKKENTHLSKKLNTLFWLAYKYRYVLAFISGLVVFHWGFVSMSYQESVIYRMETPGVIQYINSLIPMVFSVLIVAMISIIGDIKKHKKLSLFSYLCIILTILSIIAGQRIWIIALFVCLILAFQPYLKRRHMLIIIVLVASMFFIISGGVRYARQGSSLTENIKYFYEYLSNIRNMNFTEIVWGLSDFTIPFSTFITLVKNIPQNIGFDYSAPIKDLSLFIPTIIYPERPLPYNQWFVKVFYPEIFARGGGLTFYIIGFGYLFAGPIGVFIYLFLFGALFEWFNKFFRMVGDTAGLFLYSYFFVALFTFVRGHGFASFIKYCFMYLIIPLSLLFLTILILEDLFSLKRRYKTAK